MGEPARDACVERTFPAEGRARMEASRSARRGWKRSEHRERQADGGRWTVGGSVDVWRALVRTLLRETAEAEGFATISSAQDRIPCLPCGKEIERTATEPGKTARTR